MVLHMNIGHSINEETVSISAHFKTSISSSILLKLATPQLYFTPLLNFAILSLLSRTVVISISNHQNIKDQWLAVFVKV